MNKSEIIEKLNEITKSYSFVNVLAEIRYRDFIGTIDSLTTKNVHNHLNHNEYSFLIGLWIKNIDFNYILDNEAQIRIKSEVYELMNQLQKSFLIDVDNIDDAEKLDLYSAGKKTKSLQEPMFYSSDGAYCEQYLKYAKFKYKNEHSWILKNKGFDFNVITDFYNHLSNIFKKKLNKQRIDPKLGVSNLELNTLCLNKDQIVSGNKMYGKILQHLTINLKDKNNLRFNDIGDFNEFKSKPFIKLKNDLYFIPSLFAICESLYETPFYWFNDDKDYLSIASTNRGNVSEEITVELLSKIFDRKSIYKNLDIKKTKSDTLTDIDVLVTHESKGLIFQIKSKRLTILSKNGDYDNIIKDFSLAVEEAYEQGILSRECLINSKDYTFESNGKIVENSFYDIKEYFIITILLDNYPSLSHQVRIFLGEANETLPVSINIFDLELLCKYLETPNRFIDYLSKRIKFSKLYYGENEMTFLGYYLKNDLKPQDAENVILDPSWAQFIDRIYHKELYSKDLKEFYERKINRNDVCPCRSGLKFKKCCGK